tara:strand:- start:123 stop:398 length:276 start_codon:yes stop_codon:yes gene_type:complete
MNRKDLLLKAKEYKIKGIYRMRKEELEAAIFLYECAEWFSDIAGNTITINSDSEGVDISLDIIELKNDSFLYDYKRWDINDQEKINFLLKH